MKKEPLFQIGQTTTDMELIFNNKKKAAKIFSRGNKSLYKFLLNVYDKRIPTLGSNPGDDNHNPHVSFLYINDSIYITTIINNAYNLGFTISIGKSIAGQSFLKIRCNNINETNKFKSLSDTLDQKVNVLPEVLDLFKRLIDEIYLNDGTVFQIVIKDKCHLDILTDINNFKQITNDLQFNIYTSYNLTKYELITDNPEEIIYKLQVILSRI